jgi:membrane protease YdiL (CAAX protease family)
MGILFVGGRVAGAVALVAANLGAVVAGAFLFVPYFYGRARHTDLYEYGFRSTPVGKGLVLGLGFPIFVLIPAFAAGFWTFYEVVCSPEAGALRALALPGRCESMTGWHWPNLDWSVSLKALWGGSSGAFPEFVLAQFVVTALPEELFFRGFLLSLLESKWPPKRRVLGGGIGLALVVSSLLFALSHVVVTFAPHRLATFFPGLLFGWMFSATRSILAGTLAHALSNIALYVLEKSFFG